MFPGFAFFFCVRVQFGVSSFDTHPENTLENTQDTTFDTIYIWVARP